MVTLSPIAAVVERFRVTSSDAHHVHVTNNPVTHISWRNAEKHKESKNF